MRVSLTARFVSHPPMIFGARRSAPGRPRLGLPSGETVYHRPRRMRRILPTVDALRSKTSQFSFPALGRPGLERSRRQVPPQGLPRARRA